MISVRKNDKISYSDYLDLWIEDYKPNMKYNTIRTYKSIIEKYLKPNLGQYRLSGLTSYQLNNFIIELCNRYDYSRDYIRNILKVLKVSFRDATDLYGFINYNPTLTLKVPNKYGKITEYRIIANKNCKKVKNKNILVFVNKIGKYSGTESIRYPFKIIHNKLGLKSCRFYDLRGTYASKILRSGAEIRDVADLLGHRKIETTENYYISSTEETRKQINFLKILLNWK